MKLLWSIKVSILIAIAATNAHATDSSNAHAAGELLVKWKDGPLSQAATLGNARIGSTVKRNFSALGWQLVQLPSGLTIDEAIAAYHQLDTVLAAEPNGVIRIPSPVPSPSGASTLTGLADASVRPNDPRYSSQWHLPKISAPAAWQRTTGSSDIIVAVIDTGVNYKHPDLAANMWRNPGETGIDANGNEKATNGIDDDNNGYVDDVYGIDAEHGTGDPTDSGAWDSRSYTTPFYHGTLIAGIIGAVGNNGLGIAGINWNIRLMAIHSYGGDQSKPEFLHGFWSGQLAAYDYVVAMKRRGINIRVTSNSWGGHFESAALREAIRLAGDEGILTVFAVPNWTVNEDLFGSFPASARLPSIITVAASTQSDTLADFANFGKSTVDLAAPGVDILSTSSGSTYQTGSGASFACPQVAAAAALLLSVNPSLSVNELKAAIFGSVDQPAALRGKVTTNGRLNIARALDYLTNAAPIATVIHASPAGQLTSPDAPIQLTFNRAMDRLSVQDALRVEPSLSGTFTWGDDDRSVTFTPATPFDVSTNYTVRLLATAQDAAGGTLDGNFNRVAESSPADDFVWSFRFPIANDNFANAQPLPGISGSIQASNRYASLELTEPITYFGDNRKYGASVWYRWTSPETGGWFTFDLTSGTAFDSLLILYAGERLDQLVAVAGNDNYGTRTGSRISFLSEPRSSYPIVVASKDEFDTSVMGDFKLSWYPTPPPGFTGTQFFPSSGDPGSKITLTGTNFTGATAVLFNVASASFTNAPTDNVDLRITAVVPSDATSGPITIMTPHGNVTSIVSFQVLPPSLTVRLISASDLEITWPATSNTFVLEVSEDLSSGSWIAVAANPLIANGQTRFTLTAAPGKRFYRLRGN